MGLSEKISLAHGLDLGHSISKFKSWDGFSLFSASFLLGGEGEICYSANCVSCNAQPCFLYPMLLNKNCPSFYEYTLLSLHLSPNFLMIIMVLV